MIHFLGEGIYLIRFLFLFLEQCSSKNPTAGQEAGRKRKETSEKSTMKEMSQETSQKYVQMSEYDIFPNGKMII